MLQQLVQSELAYPTSSLFSSSLSSRRCICLFHIAVSEYMPKFTYFSSRRCVCLFHIVVSEYMPKITYFSVVFNWMGCVHFPITLHLLGLCRQFDWWLWYLYGYFLCYKRVSSAHGARRLSNYQQNWVRLVSLTQRRRCDGVICCLRTYKYVGVYACTQLYLTRLLFFAGRMTTAIDWYSICWGSNGWSYLWVSVPKKDGCREGSFDHSVFWDP